MEPSPPSAPHVRRADAERNRGRILDAARAAFADPEADVSMAEVARRAGVGSATLYRNFANRRALLEALYVDEIDAVCDAATVVDVDTAGERLLAWLRRFYDYFTSKRLVASELLEVTDPGDPMFGAGRARVEGAGRPLLRAAVESGEARDDLALAQILDMLAAIAKIPRDEQYRAPILRAALQSLRRAGAADQG